MNDKTYEQMSAFVDGELGTDEADALCESFQKDKALRESWARYNLISDTMRHELPEVTKHDLAARVCQSLENEPTILAPTARSNSMKSAMKHVASFAVAASITAVAIIGIQTYTASTPTSGITEVATAPDNRAWVRVSGTRWDINKPSVESKLNAYLVKHNEYASGAGTTGMLPYASIVGYDTGIEESNQAQK
jgi:sigma-E factor negative regulatory protein RseA